MADDASRDTPRDLTRGRAIDSALGGVVVSCVAAIVVLATRATIGRDNPHWSIAAGLGALTTVSLGLLLMRPRFRGREGTVACLATLGWLPFEALAFLVGRQPVLESESGHRMHCGTGTLGMLVMAPLAAIGMLAVGLVVAVSLRGASFAAARRWVAVCSLVVVGLAVAVGVAEARRPTADAYLVSLPVVGTVALHESFVLDNNTRIHYQPIEAEAREPVHESSCGLQEIAGAAYWSYGCGPLTLRHDRAARLWVAQTGEGVQFVFDESTLAARDVYGSDLTPFVGPPIEWTVTALFGLVFGSFAFVLGARAQRRAAKLSGINGALAADRWVTLAEGPPVRLTGHAELEPGAVFLELGVASRATYRETGAGELIAWHRGTLQTIRSALLGRADALYALALTSALLCGAPLLLCALRGAP